MTTEMFFHANGYPMLLTDHPDGYAVKVHYTEPHPNTPASEDQQLAAAMTAELREASNRGEVTDLESAGRFVARKWGVADMPIQDLLWQVHRTTGIEPEVLVALRWGDVNLVSGTLQLVKESTQAKALRVLQNRLAQLGKAVFGDEFVFETDEQPLCDPGVTIDDVISISIVCDNEGHTIDDKGKPTTVPTYVWGMVSSTPGNREVPPDVSFEEMGSCRGTGLPLDEMLQSVLHQVVKVRCSRKLDAESDAAMAAVLSEPLDRLYEGGRSTTGLQRCHQLTDVTRTRPGDLFILVDDQHRTENPLLVIATNRDVVAGQYVTFDSSGEMYAETDHLIYPDDIAPGGKMRLFTCRRSL